MQPKLTVGIPTVDRSEHIQYALDSCLKQTLPVHIIVADQGHSDKTAAVMARYKSHPQIEHIQTDATCLWENWKAAARACTTEYFAWLQDDDTLARVFADRVVKGFEAFPPAVHWQGSCYCSPNRIHVVKQGWNGPQVPVNMQDLVPEMWPGEIVPASMYCTCWALAPGWAFRCGEAFDACLDSIPSDCDLFTERIIPAFMGSRGNVVADPIVAGYWHHHGQNESYAQNANGSYLRQAKSMVAALDDITDATKDWQGYFVMWLRTRSPVDAMTWLSEAHKNKTHPIALSRHTEAIQQALRESLDGRVEAVQKVPGNGTATADGESLVWR